LLVCINFNNFPESTDMRKNQLLSVLSLFLLVPASITRAQTISSQKGLTTAVFSLKNGDIKVYLPDDIRPGDIISGTVVAEPFGKNAKQMEVNLAALKKFSVSINGEKFTVGEARRKILCKPEEKGGKDFGVFGIEYMCINPAGENAGKLTMTSNPGPSSATCSIPTHALTAAPLRITGPFDGDASNTKCSLDNKPVEILAESPRQCFIAYPPEAMGIQTLTVQEIGKPPCSKPVSGVNMNVSAGKLNLIKGEKTYIDVNISGLQHLPDSALLTLNNITISTVALQPSNNMVIILRPDSVSTGNFHRQFDVQSIRSGNFSVKVDLDLPEDNPPFFADVKNAVGGKRDDGVLTAGTHTALELAMKKWADANTEGRNPIDYDCPNCFQCIKTITAKSNVSQVGGLGWGIITSFLSGAIGFAGGILNKVKDIADKGGDIYKAIQQMIDAGELQVIGFEEQWCPANEY
jgi:hypothetical protein